MPIVFSSSQSLRADIAQCLEREWGIAHPTLRVGHRLFVIDSPAHLSSSSTIPFLARPTGWRFLVPADDGVLSVETSVDSHHRNIRILRGPIAETLRVEIARLQRRYKEAATRFELRGLVIAGLPSTTLWLHPRTHGADKFTVMPPSHPAVSIRRILGETAFRLQVVSAFEQHRNAQLTFEGVGAGLGSA